MSVVLVCLPGAPKVSEEAVRKDAELNNYLESRVEGENEWSDPNRPDLKCLARRENVPLYSYRRQRCSVPGRFMWNGCCGDDWARGWASLKTLHTFSSD